MKHWPLHKAYFWETAPFFRLLLPLIAGILFYYPGLFKIRGQFSADIVLAISLVSFSLFLLVSSLPKKSFTPLANFLLVNISLFCIAWSLCWFNDIRNSHAWFGNSVNVADAYLARIITTPVEKEKTFKIELEVLQSLHGNKTLPTKGQAFVYVYKNGRTFPFHKGDTVFVPDKWKAIQNQGNPFEFDYAAYCGRNNLFYQQFLSPHDIALYANANAKDISLIERTHEWCTQQLEKYIPDTGAKNLIQAMLLGDEIYLDQNLLNAYSETGIVHIIAISGSNITIFFLGVSFLFWWLKNKKYTWIKYVIALPLVWFYVVMAGAPPSAVRAAAMFSILALGFVLQKNANSLNHLFATAIILLCAEPMWLFSIGFQLSFVAVLSLILFYKPVYKLLSPLNIISKKLWEALAASIAAEILVAPLVIYYFHMFPLMFIIANLAAFLFMGLVSILGLLIVSFGFIPLIANTFGIIASLMVIYFNRMIYWLQNINPTSFHFLVLSAAELFLVYISISTLAIFLLKKTKPAIFVCLASLSCLLIFFCHDEWTSLRREQLVVYNINKMNHIELIQGKYFSVLNTDTSVTANKKDYILRPAHTNWNAWRTKNVPPSDLFLIGNKTVLLLNKPITTTAHFPVDYLVLNYPLKKTDLRQLMETFSPQKIILGNNNSRYIIDKYFEKSKESNIPLHSLAYNGAFVISSYQ